MGWDFLISLDKSELGAVRMPLKIFLSSTLRRYHPGYRPSTGIDLDLDKPLTVAELCGRIKIPPEDVKLVLVNGKSESMAFELKGEERIGLFPPLGGG